jgi:hypothetical protein
MSEELFTMENQPDTILCILRTLTYFHGDAVFHCGRHCQQDCSSNRLKVRRATCVFIIPRGKNNLTSAENKTSRKMGLNGSPLLTTCEILPYWHTGILALMSSDLKREKGSWCFRAKMSYTRILHAHQRSRKQSATACIYRLAGHHWLQVPSSLKCLTEAHLFTLPADTRM